MRVILKINPVLTIYETPGSCMEYYYKHLQYPHTEDLHRYLALLEVSRFLFLLCFAIQLFCLPSMKLGITIRLSLLMTIKKVIKTQMRSVNKAITDVFNEELLRKQEAEHEPN